MFYPRKTTQRVRRTVILMLISMTYFCLIATDCGREQHVCVDFSGMDLSVRLLEPSVSDDLCSAFALPDDFALTVDNDFLVECVQRASIDLSTVGLTSLATVIAPSNRVSLQDRFAYSEKVKIEGTECTGNLYFRFSSRTMSQGESDLGTLLRSATDTDMPWLVQRGFDADAESDCSQFVTCESHRFFAELQPQ